MNNCNEKFTSIISSESPLIRIKDGNQINSMVLWNEKEIFIASFKEIHVFDIEKKVVTSIHCCHESNITSILKLSNEYLSTTGFDGYVKLYLVKENSRFTKEFKLVENILIENSKVMNSFVTLLNLHIVVASRGLNNLYKYFWVEFDFGSKKEFPDIYTHINANCESIGVLLVQTYDFFIGSISLRNMNFRMIFDDIKFNELTCMKQIRNSEIAFGFKDGSIVCWDIHTQQKKWNTKCNSSLPIIKFLGTFSFMLVNTGNDYYILNDGTLDLVNHFKDKPRITSLLQDCEVKKIYFANFNGEVYENRQIDKRAFTLFCIENTLNGSVHSFTLKRRLFHLLI